MSLNIQQIYTANPATNVQSTDLFYLGRSPYGTSDDYAITGANLLASATSGAVLLAPSGAQTITGFGLTVPSFTIGTSNLVLAGSLTTAGAFGSTFTMTGTTSVTFPTSGTLATTSQIPSVVPAALTKNNDTNVTLTLGGTPNTALLQATSITAGWTGTLAVGRGGLGIASTPTNGQIPIGNGTNYTAATLTAGTGISITNASGSITLSYNGASPWVDETGASVTMATNTGYTSDDGATLVTFTLPTTSAIGDFVEINGKGAGGWKIAQAAGQQIHFGSSATTSGTGGSLASTLQFDNVRLRCITANTIFTVVSVQGTLTVV